MLIGASFFFFLLQEQKFLIGLILMVPVYAVESVCASLSTYFTLSFFLSQKFHFSLLLMYFSEISREFVALIFVWIAASPTYWD